MRAQGRPVKVSFPAEKRSYQQMMQEHTGCDRENKINHSSSFTGGFRKPAMSAVNKLSSFVTHTAADVMVAQFSHLLEVGQLQRPKAVSVL